MARAVAERSSGQPRYLSYSPNKLAMCPDAPIAGFIALIEDELSNTSFPPCKVKRFDWRKNTNVSDTTSRPGGGTERIRRGRLPLTSRYKVFLIYPGK